MVLSLRCLRVSKFWQTCTRSRFLNCQGEPNIAINKTMLKLHDNKIARILHHLFHLHRETYDMPKIILIISFLGSHYFPLLLSMFGNMNILMVRTLSFHPFWPGFHASLVCCTFLSWLPGYYFSPSSPVSPPPYKPSLQKPTGIDLKNAF